MEVIVAECSATYSGRGDTVLPRGVRALLIKSDGSVSIHNDNSNKPLNYMKMASRVESRNEQGEAVWTFDARHESLAITLHRIVNGFEHQLLTKATEPGISSSGTEKDLQAWLFENPHAVKAGFVSIEREFNTGAGAVDILMIDEEGAPVAVEVKRVAMLGAVDQVRRYVEAMKTLGVVEVPHPVTGDPFIIDFSRTYGLIAALDLRPKMLALAEKREVPTVTVPRYWRPEESTQNFEA